MGVMGETDRLPAPPMTNAQRLQERNEMEGGEGGSEMEGTGRIKARRSQQWDAGVLSVHKVYL